MPRRITNEWRAWRGIGESLLTRTSENVLDYPCRAYEGCVCSSKQQSQREGECANSDASVFFFFSLQSPLGASRAACTASVPVVALFLDMPTSFIAISLDPGNDYFFSSKA